MAEKYERKQKVLNAISKPKTHVLLCSKVENGGYEFAWDKEGNVCFSLSAMRKYWPNWVVEMNEAQMIMCACEICQIMNDAHVALLGKRGKMIKRDEARLEELTGSTRSVVQEKAQMTSIFEEYKSQVQVKDANGDSRPIYADGWEACDQYGCNKRVCIDVDGKKSSFLHYKCQKGDCEDCNAAGYTPLHYKTNHIGKDEMIK